MTTTHIRTLQVVRRGYQTGPGTLSYTVSVPLMVLPESDPGAEFVVPENAAELGSLLGWSNPVPPGACIEYVLPVGLVAPTRWESLYIRWLCETLGAELAPGSETWPTGAGSSGPSSVASNLSANGGRFWASVTEVPEGVTVVRTESRRGEARHAAKSVRSWLSRQSNEKSWELLCDDLLVLLPADPSFMAVWIEAFESLDLPVRATTFRPLARDPFVQWVIDLAHLAGWSDTVTMPRALLQRVLLSRFWSASAARRSLGLEGRSQISRSSLADLLRSLRRSTVTLDEWREHVLTSGLGEKPRDGEREAREALAKMTDALAALLAPADLADSLRSVLSGGKVEEGLDLGVAKALRALHGKEKAPEDEWQLTAAAVLLERVRIAVGGVASKEGEEDESVVRAAQLGALVEELDGQFIAERRDPMHGVTFLPYSHYDHRRASLLIMAGLGEGQFPSTAKLPSDGDVVWLKILGLLDEQESGPAWVVHDAEQQVNTARAALLQVDEAILSFSTEGPGTEEVHPGSLLSLLAGGWNEEDWNKGGERVLVLPGGTDIPRHVGEAAGWREARLFANDSGTRRDLARAAEGDGVALEQVRQLDDLEKALGTSRRADAERRPETPSQFGAYTGRLPGATCLPLSKRTEPPVYSPTSLEKFGQCPYQYFLGRILRLNAVEDAGDALDPLETGSTIHAAFAEATREVIDGKDGAVWDLTFALGSNPEETAANKERKVEEVLGLLLPRVSDALGGLVKKQPTLCGPLLDEMGRRWGQAIRNWVETHVHEYIPVCLDDEAIDVHPRVVAALQALAGAELRCQNVTDEFAENVRNGDVTNAEKAKEWAGRLSAAGGAQVKGAIYKLMQPHLKVLKSGESTEVEAALKSLEQDCLDCALQKSREVLETVRSAERERRSNAGMAHKVAFAELSFGRTKDPESDPHSLPDPWEGECPSGRKVLVTGQVDRIDWDEERSALAVRDYKSGKSKSKKKLLLEMREGRHLQLLLYACAIEDVLVNGTRFPAFANHKVSDVALEFPKVTGSSGVDFSEEVAVAEPLPEGAKEEAENGGLSTQTWREVGLTWLDYHTAAIEDGRFDLMPQKCPLVSGGAYCDFKRVCGFSKEHADKFENDLPRPIFGAPEEPAKEKPKPKPTAAITPSMAADSSNTQRDRETHKRGQEMAKDLEHDVIVSAGAGTGKTWNLVRRYLAALDTGVAPEEILCVTFTRKAAAEMRQRVRAGLLERANETGDGSLSRELRDKILTLSAAPIWTLDSLALHLLETLHDARGEDGGQAVPPALDPAGASAELEQFLSERFLQAVSDVKKDKTIRFLMDHVSVGNLRKELKSVIGSACGVPGAAWPASADEVLAGWESLVAPLVKRVRDFVRTLDIDEWEELLNAESEKIVPENVERVKAAVESARRLAETAEVPVLEALGHIATVENMPTSQKGPNGIGKRKLYAWLQANSIPVLLSSVLGHRSEAAAAVKTLTERPDELHTFAEIAYRTLDLCRRWSEEFEERLRQRGTLRYGDVESAALRALTEESDAELLRQHLPFKHIFVDESQDTSERQARLVSRLAELTEARLFWVGDPKQSIYRFRGAEVDVFEERVNGAGEVASLRVNRRSHPRLIQAVNRLFGAMFEAKNGDEHLDPGSEVTFESQTWPESRVVTREDGTKVEMPWVVEEEEPRIEWIVESAAVEGKADADTGEELDEEESSEEDTSEDEASPDEDAVAVVAIRVRQILDEFVKDGKQVPSGHVALLVRTWDQAKSWNDELARLGVACAVQGGGGLLKTPEAELLRLWLEAVVLNDEVALAGILRGPGVAMSDAGLYCLRMGYGVTPKPFEGQTFEWKPPFRLSHAVQWDFDSVEAAAAWNAASGLNDIASCEESLGHDAEALSVFGGVWLEFGRRVQIGSVADALEWLIERLGLEAYWNSAVGTGGAQAVANLRALLDVVREYEASHGSSPFRLLRHLNDLAEGDDPSAGGLDAGIGTPVVVTTAWQAKGREWPVVVLPSLSDFKLRSDGSGMGVRRIVQFDLATGKRGEVIHVPDVVATTEKKPFEASDKPVPDLLNVYRAPAERAELRRLLYVAMTRAKERLILVGGYTPKVRTKTPFSEHEGTQYISLAGAQKWSELVGMCAALEYKPVKNEAGEEVTDKEGKPVTRPKLGDGVWRVGEDVILRTTDEVRKEGYTKPSEPKSVPFEPTVVKGWCPILSDQRKRENPSRQKAVDEVPPPGLIGAGWPKSKTATTPPFDQENDAGTAFHKLMELWAFGATGIAMDEELAGAALDETGLGGEETRAARCAWLVKMAGKIESGNAALLAKLRAAAAAGTVYHEVPLCFDRADGPRVEGTIDLLWKDEAGWHLLDYKAGSDYPHGTGEEPLRHENLRKHYAQVSLYAEGLPPLLDGPLVDFGVWYVPAALAVVWKGV